MVSFLFLNIGKKSEHIYMLRGKSKEMLMKRVMILVWMLVF